LVAELSKVIQVIGRPDQRKSIPGHAGEALERAGVNVKLIPKEVVGTLNDLDENQLSLLSRLGDSFTKAGLVLGEVPEGGRVWFF
jgi:hypothetical protein